MSIQKPLRLTATLLVLLLAACSGGESEPSPADAATATGAESGSTIASSEAPPADQVDDLATGDVGSPPELSDEEATVAVRALGFYNWSSEQLEAKLEADRARLVEVNELIAACMAEEGFTYFPADPDTALQQWSGFEYQYGTQRWAGRYGLGVTTLIFVQKEIPDGLVGSPQALPVVQASEDGKEVQYLDSLGADGRDRYFEALYLGEDSCQGEAYASVPEFENTENIDFTEIDIDDLRQRTLSSSDYVEAAADASRCVEDAGFDVGSEAEAYDHMTQRLIDSEFESDQYVDFGSVPPQLTPAGEVLLGSLQAYEVDLAAALWDCGATTRQLNVVAEQVSLRLLVEAIAAE